MQSGWLLMELLRELRMSFWQFWIYCKVPLDKALWFYQGPLT
jgi:hypothetical protein